MKHVVNILLIGPSNSGKTKIANYLADLNHELPDDLKPTKTLRIVEFDINNVDVDGTKCDIDVQLWDTSGNEMYNYYWAVYRQYANGIVFVYSQENEVDHRKLDLMYNYFINGRDFNHRACLVCCLTSENSAIPSAKLSSSFARISEVKANLEMQGEKFRDNFIKYVVSVVQTLQ